MTATTAPALRRSLIGMAVSAIAARRSRTDRPSKLAAFAAVAREHVVTAAALTSVDIGAFHGGQCAGYIVTGVSVLLLHFSVTG